MTNSSRKIALVTGANRGIGLEISKQLAQEGTHVLLSGRNEMNTITASKILQDKGLPVDPITLDVTSKQSIEAASRTLRDNYGHLDILVNNAGIRIEEYGKNPSQQPLDQWRQTFETNIFGMVAVTQEFLPLLRKASAASIVNVSSLLGSVGTHSDKESYAYSEMFKSLPAYSASKSAVNSWTVHLAFELRNTKIKVNAVHPGYTKTDMNDGAGELEISDGAKTSVMMALVNGKGPSGSYVHMDETIPW